MRRLTFLFVLLFPFYSFSQNLNHIESRGDYFHVYTLSVDKGRLSTINLPVSATGVSFQIDLHETFVGSYIICAGEKIDIIANTHDKETAYEGRFKVSELILIEPNCKSIQLYSNLLSGKIVFHLYHAGVIDISKSHTRGDADSLACSKPKTIDQSVWRDGLPAPTENPAFTQTDHVVVHHSAGSNLNTDHLSAIRTIYIYHTQTNGWDDIGYNYVIARDGTIYDAREGHNLVEEDFVKGAHFCGKNSNTMGVSILGTYTNELPPDTAVSALVWLLSWKLHKDQLNPLDSSIHPRGGNDYLPVICGHQDGCATICPGDIFYSQFNQIRNEVWEKIKNCPSNTVLENKTNMEAVVYPQPASSKIFIRIASDFQNTNTLVQLFRADGQIIYQEIQQNTSFSVDVSQFGKGVYFLKIQSDKHYYQQLVLLN
ncbi:MAG: T9SS type A sorting domain-containing protein [Bacteroidetes bacterium]|nr:T9SS type A sorting domain-containing protein [Bacteroidota bacterium]